MPLVRIEIIKGRNEREESTREDWSSGNGIAQYLVLPKEEWE